MSEVLDPAEVRTALSGSSWTFDGSSISLEGQESDFASAWRFVSLVADAAEQADHHPDILVHEWNRWRIVLSTHSAGGVTAADIALAQAINRLSQISDGS